MMVVRLVQRCNLVAFFVLDYVESNDNFSSTPDRFPRSSTSTQFTDLIIN
jgi:hypothetical protein